MFGIIACSSAIVSGNHSDKGSKTSSSYVIGTYNVENLFDTIDDPKTEDEWFLPTSETKWNSEKYFKKLDNLSKVIDAMNPAFGGPDIIGLCEVENKQVVEALSSQNSLKENHYAIVHYDSPDTRGIDVAAMYDKTKFKLISSRSIAIEIPEDPNIKTRDILYCEFETIGSGEKIHFYVNHWSSRRGGENETEFKRKRCAQTLLEDIKSMIKNYKDQNIVIVGDLNDYPMNNSVYEVLGAKEAEKSSDLIDLCYSVQKAGEGTYNHKGEWGCLDHIIITSSMKSIIESNAIVLKEEWMLYTNKQGEQYPNRTYGGSNYYGGYSDHLPVYFSIKL